MLLDEEILTFTEAAKKLPKVGGKSIHTSTLWRWARKGLRGVRLEVLRLGGRFVTSAEALERFARALAESDAPAAVASGSPTPQAHRTPAQRARGIERARQRLEKAGI